MAQPFKADSQTIGDLLSGPDKPRLVIPPFQRGYSWEKKHVEALWNDLTQFLSEKTSGLSTKYFLGPIVLLEKGGTIEVLDGQQRLATATILFAAIRDAAQMMGTPASTAFAHAVETSFIEKSDAGDHLGWCLELGSLDKTYFKNTIQTFPAVKTAAKLKSQRNIRDAFKFFNDNIALKLVTMDSISGLDYLKGLRNAVRSDCVLTCIPVDDERDAFRIFETLNDRGLRLSAPDLLLNFLMKNASEADRVEIRKYWDQMLEGMGKRNINDFLRHMWISKFGDLKNKDLFTALKEHIMAENSVSLEYARLCAEECEQYRVLIDADEKHLNGNAVLVRTIVRSLDCKLALPLLLSSYSRLSPASFLKLLRLVIVFIVRWDAIAGKGNAGMENLLYALARSVRKERENKAVAQGKEENQCILNVKTELAKSAPDDAVIEAAAPNLLLTQDTATYLVDRLANYMQSNTKEVALGETSLEHIFPRNPSSEWTNAVGMEPFLWHIGNLIMLGERLNGKSANSGFATKKPIYAKSELEMAKSVAATYTEWDETTVRSRAMKLVPLINHVWNFDNPSRVA
jgi:hypothetical protein